MKKLKIDQNMPLLMDFIQQHSIDPSVIFSKFSNYYEFLVRYKKIDTLLTENESKNLVFFSRQIAPGLKRIDSLVLEELLKNEFSTDELKNKMLNEVKDITEDRYRYFIKNFRFFILQRRN